MGPKLKVDYDIGPLMHHHEHGEHKKIGIVLHETVSRNAPGLKDIRAVADFLGLGKDGYAIHGINDAEGLLAHTKGYGEDIYWHCAGGHANTNFMGLEQVGRIMLDYTDRTSRIRAWLHLEAQLNSTAKYIACCARGHGWPIVDNHGDTSKPGVTTHYEVSKFNKVPGAHTDCWPSHLGGYYPKRLVLTLAKRYYALGWHF